MNKSFAGNEVPADHRPTVFWKNGEIQFTEDEINIGERKVKNISIMPKNGEQVIELKSRKDLFSSLQFMNLLMTNACNLSCSYCYEQHNKDFGRFTLDSIKEAWDFLRDINNISEKTMQFFGGEPLIHKEMILSFIEKYHEEIARETGHMYISITTNGLLLTDDFIKRYFALPNTKLMISLDTKNAKIDHREISQENIDKLLDRCDYITNIVDHTRFSVRATVSREVAPELRDFWEALYERGVRQMVFHPLILSYTDGYIPWTVEEWENFSNTIKGIVRDYPEEVRFVQIAEGVGIREETNCLTGSDTISIDPAGDFSGCYFFTNRKGSNTGDFILGNIYKNSLFIDRYQTFKETYETMFEEEEQCKTCDMKNVCYQCPAGNISTGEKLFRPDDMCQKFVKLHLDIKDLILQQTFKTKLVNMATALKDEGTVVYSKIAINLFNLYFRGFFPEPDDIRDALVEAGDIDFQYYYGFFKQTIEQGHKKRSLGLNLGQLVHGVKKANTKATPRELYFLLLKEFGIGTALNIKPDMFNKIDENLLFSTMIHFVIANKTKHKPFGMGG